MPDKAHDDKQPQNPNSMGAKRNPPTELPQTDSGPDIVSPGIGHQPEGQDTKE